MPDVPTSATNPTSAFTPTPAVPASEQAPGAANQAVPTLYDWLGGEAVLARLMQTFYGRVPADPLLGSVFAGMPATHAAHVTQFVAEVLGGPGTYSETLGGAEGGHVRMIARHLGRSLTEAQRARWVGLLLSCADDVGVPDDPEFRSALVAYLEWGSRLAVLNSQPGVPRPEPAPMPKWGWGVPGGPYRPAASDPTHAPE
jgi:hemoglobin